MKLWTAEQSARALLALLLAYGALMSGAGIIVSVAVSHGNGSDPENLHLFCMVCPSSSKRSPWQLI